MASFRFRNNRWQARVQRKGQKDLAKSFLNKPDAEKWARSVEIEIDRGTFINNDFAQKTLFKEIL